ncbi:MAG: hypothetical protein ACE5Z5_06215 [Candidatus Bathyarchaeia archaeon]
MVKIDRIGFVDLDFVEWTCSCGEKNDWTYIIGPEDTIECLDCGKKYRVRVEVIVEELKSGGRLKIALR